MGKSLAANNHKKKESKKREEAQNCGVSQYYGIRAVIAVTSKSEVIGGLGYYIYQSKKGATTAKPSREVPNNPPNQPSLPVRQTNKFEMD